MNSFFEILKQHAHIYGWAFEQEAPYRLRMHVGDWGDIIVETNPSGRDNQATINWYLDNAWSCVLEGRDGDPETSGHAKWSTVLPEAQYGPRLMKIVGELRVGYSIAQTKLATIAADNRLLKEQAGLINAIPWLKAEVHQERNSHPAFCMRAGPRYGIPKPRWVSYQTMNFVSGSDASLDIMVRVPITKLRAFEDALNRTLGGEVCG